MNEHRAHDRTSRISGRRETGPAGTNRGRRWGAVLAVVAVVGLGAIGVAAALSGGGSLDSGAISAGAAASGERAELAAFSTEVSGSGERFTAADVEGPAVIHVYASWCEVCQSEAPGFAQLQRRYPDLNYYLLNVRDEAAAGREFMERHGWSDNSTLLHDPQRSAESQLGLTGQPNTVFVDADGRVARTLTGGVGTGDLLEAAARITEA